MTVNNRYIWELSSFAPGQFISIEMATFIVWFIYCEMFTWLFFCVYNTKPTAVDQTGLSHEISKASFFKSRQEIQEEWLLNGNVVFPVPVWSQKKQENKSEWIEISLKRSFLNRSYWCPVISLSNPICACVLSFRNPHWTVLRFLLKPGEC